MRSKKKTIPEIKKQLENLIAEEKNKKYYSYLQHANPRIQKKLIAEEKKKKSNNIAFYLGLKTVFEEALNMRSKKKSNKRSFYLGLEKAFGGTREMRSKKKTNRIQIKNPEKTFPVYLFSWGDVPGNDSKRLIDHLVKTLKIDWAENAEIEKNDNSKYLFSWDNIPGNDRQLINHLVNDLKIDWTKNATINKSDNGKIITVTEGKNSLELKLNKKENKVILETSGGKTYGYILKAKKDNLNIYNSKTITVTKDENSLELELNEKEKKVILKISSGKSHEYIFKKKKNKINIYFPVLLIAEEKKKKSNEYFFYLGQKTAFEEAQKIRSKKKSNEYFFYFYLGQKKALEELGKMWSYLFNWDDIPGNDSMELINHLVKNLKIDWAKNATINKSDNGKIIIVTEGKNSLELKLNKEENKAILEISGGETYEYISKEKKHNLKIYVRHKKKINQEIKKLEKLIAEEKIYQKIVSLESDIVSNTKEKKKIVNLEPDIVSDAEEKLRSEGDMKREKKEGRKIVSNTREKLRSEGVDNDILEDISINIPPEKVKQVVKVYKRNQKLIAKLKKKYNDRCQICNDTFEKKDGGFYSEAHHLIPLGEKGYDAEDNIVILCPTCHKKLHFAKEVKIDERKGDRQSVTINGVRLEIKY